MAALSRIDIDVIMPVAAAINAYVIGAARREIATRNLPALETVVRDAAHLDADQNFQIGLDCLLDGIEARISR